MDHVTVLAPATVSNVVCGFDCLGFALHEPYDEMRLRVSPEPGIRITHLDAYGLPTDAGRNVAGVALQAFIDAADIRHGFDLTIKKNIMPGSGVGSSAASAAGAVVAADQLMGTALPPLQLVELAMAGEMLASGSRHADNLAPCIYGGFVLVRSADPLDIVPLAHPPLFATVLHPQIEVKTSEARAMLPEQVPLRSAVKNWSNLGAFVAALTSGDQGLLSRSMSDEIIEPARAALIPHFAEVRGAALDAGAIGSGISGAGPSIFALSDTAEVAGRVRDAMESVYRPTGIDHLTYISPISGSGVRVL